MHLTCRGIAIAGGYLPAFGRGLDQHFFGGGAHRSERNPTPAHRTGAAHALLAMPLIARGNPDIHLFKSDFEFSGSECFPGQDETTQCCMSAANTPICPGKGTMM